MRRTTGKAHAGSAEFQFTHPGRGATEWDEAELKDWGLFQFTHPGRGATRCNPSALWLLEFQFTHPGRGATVLLIFIFDGVLVSIHAPREGCDCIVNFLPLLFVGFQFTHPGRGATTRRLPALYACPGFQFTHPGRGATSPFEQCSL